MTILKITVIAGNGISGTDKAALIYGAELSKKGHHVTAITNRIGPRSPDLIEAGVTIHDIPYETDAIKQHLEDFAPDIVHQHVPGYGDHRALYHALDQFVGKRPKVIETNVFGRLMDRHDKGHVSFRMFVSMASGCQAFRRPCIQPASPSIEKHTILSNPLSDYNPPTEEKRRLVRNDLGVAETDSLWIRLGRPAGKWTTWDCEAFASSRKRNSRLKLLLMEPPSSLAGQIKAGRYGDGIIIRPTSSDFAYLSDLYGSADGMLQATNFGESYGYTLAEAMQASLPIVTMSTPWGDNAQVQLVGHSENGYVCCSVPGMAEALLDITANRELYQRMANLAQPRISEISNRTRDVDLLEEIMIFVTSGTLGPLMQDRFSEWMKYRDQSFGPAQNDIYERDRGMTLPVIRWKSYSKYRNARAAARHTLEILRNRFSS